MSLYKDEYSKSTEDYIHFRKAKIDPITHYPADEGKSLVISNIWNPYTGEYTSEKDPYGPLLIDVKSMLLYLHGRRLSSLVYNNDGVVSYGDAVGRGAGMESGRGGRPERYMFRVPVNNCYTIEGFDHQATMGPLLTKKEIRRIDNLLLLNYSEDKTVMGLLGGIVSVKAFKKAYDLALGGDDVSMEQSTNALLFLAALDSNDRRASDVIHIIA